jgi:hypothetical protein
LIFLFEDEAPLCGAPFLLGFDKARGGIKATADPYGMTNKRTSNGRDKSNGQSHSHSRSFACVAHKVCEQLRSG